MSKVKESFDLTSRKGLERAMALLKSNGQLAHLLGMGVLGPIFGPSFLFSKIVSECFDKQNESQDNQVEFISKILRAGKDSGASEIEIIVDSDVGVDVGAKLPPDLGDVDIRFNVGAKSKTVIRAKYRDA